MLLERIVAAVARHHMFSTNQRAGVAVSGGADSVFLLHALHELAPRWNLQLSVVHIDHGIRGPASRDDDEFVRSPSHSPPNGAPPGLELRNWRPGDQYRRSGQSHEQKLKELFQVEVRAYLSSSFYLAKRIGLGAAGAFAARPSMVRLVAGVQFVESWIFAIMTSIPLR